MISLTDPVTQDILSIVFDYLEPNNLNPILNSDYFTCISTKLLNRRKKHNNLLQFLIWDNYLLNKTWIAKLNIALITNAKNRHATITYDGDYSIVELYLLGKFFDTDWFWMLDETLQNKKNKSPAGAIYHGDIFRLKAHRETLVMHRNIKPFFESQNVYAFFEQIFIVQPHKTYTERVMLKFLAMDKYDLFANSCIDLLLFSMIIQNFRIAESIWPKLHLNFRTSLLPAHLNLLLTSQTLTSNDVFVYLLRSKHVDWHYFETHKFTKEVKKFLGLIANMPNIRKYFCDMPYFKISLYRKHILDTVVHLAESLEFYCKIQNDVPNIFCAENAFYFKTVVEHCDATTWLQLRNKFEFVSCFKLTQWQYPPKLVLLNAISLLRDKKKLYAYLSKHPSCTFEQKKRLYLRDTLVLRLLK